MGLFGKLFDKKACSICGGEIGLLGNRKLEDGNLCKQCSAKLSPFFTERRVSTVAEIEEQLEYRENNKEKVANFHTTRTMGNDWKILFDEDARRFMVTRARKLTDANPDVIDFSQVTGIKIDIDEHANEDEKEDQEGKKISYNPPRYFYSYDFNVIIHVNHPYFDKIEFRLNAGSVEINPETSVIASRKPNPMRNIDYKEYYEMTQEIKDTLNGVRQQVREEAAAAAAPKEAITCPWCGATTTANASGCCEYCGGSLKG